MLTFLFRPTLALAAQAAWWLAPGRQARRTVRWQRDIRYRPDSHANSHLLDILTPREGPGPWPLVVYVHGGGFTVGSKQTHALMAAKIAESGFCVANINYRLAPRHRYPAALEDVAYALAYLGEHGASLGAMPHDTALMGESAGANLVLAVAMALCSDAPPAWALPAVHSRIRPSRIVPACGLLDVTDAARFGRGVAPPTRMVQQRIRAVCQAVLPPGTTGAEPELAWASPLKLLEGAYRAARPLPPMAVGCGANDPIRDDSIRLVQALSQRNVAHHSHTYPGGGHVFFAWPNHPQNEAFWRDTVAFLSAPHPAATARPRR